MADVTTLSAQLAARKMAVAYVWEWLNKDVIGFVGQQESNSQKLIEKQESYIDRQ